jgi:hypothetical protein
MEELINLTEKLKISKKKKDDVKLETLFENLKISKEITVSDKITKSSTKVCNNKESKTVASVTNDKESKTVASIANDKESKTIANDKETKIIANEKESKVISDTILLTEDLGKIFEKAICLVFNTPYIGPYKYGLDEPNKLKLRLEKLKDHFPSLVHTAEKGGRYDFTCDKLKDTHLSAKTTKKGGKVAPQDIGQPSISKFCSIFELGEKTIPQLKEWIQKNPKILLARCEKDTFDCKIIYYNKMKNMIKFINKKTDIKWDEATFSFTREAKDWKNSTTLKIKSKDEFISIAEIQFHTKRKNMVFRWIFEKILEIFPDNFDIIDF